MGSGKKICPATFFGSCKSVGAIKFVAKPNLFVLVLVNVLVHVLFHVHVLVLVLVHVLVHVHVHDLGR